MVENIELRSYSVRNEPDGDIEEYDEIKHETKNVDSLSMETFASKFVPEAVNDYDFFTQTVKKIEPRNGKKKKTKKKEKLSNLMDIIGFELASLTVPVMENYIEIVEGNDEYRNSLVQSFSRDHRRFQHRKPFIDSENGQPMSRTQKKLSPMFPNLLENFTDDLQPAVPVVYVPPVSYIELINDFTSNNAEYSTKFLDVTLRDIKFKHHHKFSLEDILVMKLTELYNQYKNLQQMLKDISLEVKVNRDTKDNLKKDLLKVSPNKKDDIRIDSTIRNYTGHLLDLKEKYRTTLKKYKEVLHKILSIWSDVIMIREKLECQHTPCDLKISKHTLNSEEYETEWNKLYEEEFTDMLTTIEYDYGTKLIDYKVAKHDQNLESSAKRKINKPKLYIDEEEIKDKVEELVNERIITDKIDLALEKDERSISDLNNQRNTYSFEVFVDKLFVCESESFTSMDRWFNVNFSESFSIEILPNNHTLCIILLENREKVANLNVNLTDLKRHSVEDFRILELVYDKYVRPNPDFVGSGHSIKEIAIVNKVRLKSSNTFTGNLVTTCEVNAKISWSEDLNQNQSDAIKESVKIGNRLTRLMQGVDKPNVEILTELIGKIYGRDVSGDETISNTLNRLCKLGNKTNEQFTIDENSAEFVRLKLLRLRNSGGFIDVEKKMIPIHGSQISTEQLNCLQYTKEKDFDIDYLRDKEADMDPIELQRFIAAKYMQKLNKKMLKNLNEYLMVKTQKDVVREIRDFSIRGFLSRRNNAATLASVSNDSKQDILTESLSKEQEIHITVQRAFNLLDRSTSLLDEVDNQEEIIAETVPGYKVRPLRPFARISYRGTVEQTVTAIGCHPSWNHTLKLISKLDQLSTLHINVFDECKLNISEGSDDQSTLGRTVRYRYYNKWLGATQVPLYTVLSLGTLRGTFKINTPPILLGYEAVQNKESHSLVPVVKQLMKKEASYISLNITTSLAHLGGFQEFNQPLPSTAEDDYIIKHLNAFVTDYTNDFPNRSISLTFIDSAGRNKCVTQFLQPIPLPAHEYFPKHPKSCGSALSKSSGFSRSSSSKSSGRRREDVEANDERDSVYSQEANWKGSDGLVRTINACLRYVALIPNYEVTDTHIVTLMGLELLKVLHGSPLDHTLLLSSYFLYLGIKSWVAIGLGLPRGQSSYVLIQYDLTDRRFVLTSDELFRSRGFLRRNDGYLWYVCDAVSGDRHELRDAGCPMKTVDYVFDNDNIWVNVQTSQDCENVSFDLSKSSDWQTVFDKNIFVMKQPIVNDSHLYSSPGNVESLRQGLEVKIRGKVQKWRSHMKTIWNRYCSGLLRDSLPYWEYWAFNPSETKPGFSQKLKQLMVTYRVFGFPLNIPFVNTKTVLSAVKATALHVNDDPTVEFALGVEVCAYPNNVLSVWVFLATITRI